MKNFASGLCSSQFQPCPCPNCHGGAKNLEKMPHPGEGWVAVFSIMTNFMRFLHALREALIHFRSWRGNAVTSVNTNSSSVDKSETGDTVRQVRAWLYVSAEVAAVTLPRSLSESRCYNLVVPLRCVVDSEM